MIVRRLLLAGITACALAFGLLIAGCGGEDRSAAAPSAPLPIEERVVAADLGGLTTGDATHVASTPERFARLVDEEGAA